VRGSNWTIDIEVTIVHEMVHALQDQEVGLDPVFEETNAYDDSLQALQSITEGQATLVENDWIISRGDGYASAYQQELSGRSYTQGDPYSEAMSALPYVLGPRAVAKLEAAYGPQMTLQVLASPPTTIEQIWDLAGWHQGQTPLIDAVPPAEPQVPEGADIVDRGSMGVDLIALLGLPPTKWAGPHLRHRLADLRRRGHLLRLAAGGRGVRERQLRPVHPSRGHRHRRRQHAHPAPLRLNPNARRCTLPLAVRGSDGTKMISLGRL
jgi:hypothetical protein